MNDAHLISTEVDRRAYEAGQNLIRLSRYRNEREHMDRLKDRLVQEVLKKHYARSLTEVTAAINHGHALLDAGHGYDAALAESHKRFEVGA